MKKWEVLGKVQKSLPRRPSKHRGEQAGKTQKLRVIDIVEVLLKNRGMKTRKEKKEFFNTIPPFSISLKSLGISRPEMNKVTQRIIKAKKSEEKVIVFGDYDADGVCATAILWECLYELGLDALPYIPERFSEGYGLRAESVKKLKKKHKNLRLIITVDNGIVANEAIDAANELRIDVIISDHHQKGKKIPKAHSIVHTDKIGGAGVAWILAREIKKKIKGQRSKVKGYDSLELAAIGTISDQLPLIGPNRSFAKYGLEALSKTKRPGLLALFKEAGIQKRFAGWRIGTYEVNFVIAPRINAMGRMQHAVDSLRLLCTKDKSKASDLAFLLGKTNLERQRVVEDVVTHAKGIAKDSKWEGVMVLHHKSYHEGVIGLAASRLVEEFYRPAIVISSGKTHSKASARSIPGFNIIEAIRNFDEMLIDGGGHSMAAGFTIETKRLALFTRKLIKLTKPFLTKEVLSKKLKIDLELKFNQLNWKLSEVIKRFEPTGIGNPAPTFVSKNVSVLDSRVVGSDSRHLKLTLEQKGKVFDAIAFGFGEYFSSLSPETSIDMVFRLEENVWNNEKSLQLKVKDIKFTK